MTPEGRVKNKLDRRLKKLGPSVWFYSPQAGPYGAAGIPDRIVCVKGRMVGIECKRDRSHKPTKLQEKCMAKMTEAGAICLVVYDDTTLEMAIATIQAIGKLT